MAGSDNHVAEMQGLYGPFTMAERVVQKIWRDGDFDRRRAVLTDGRRLEIRAPGGWNLLGGPDFRQARVVIAGREITGDIEVHFHAADWRAHGHEADPAYANVALHVVLFPPGTGEELARRSGGQDIPTLVLLPLLFRDLEEYASDDALEAITARDDWRHLAELAAVPPAELLVLLQEKAAARWRQKIRFARLRIDKLGWTEAAHHSALEIFGYRQNRAAMLAVATRYSLKAWATGLDPQEIFREEEGSWRLQGVRPANHPLRRLRQYRDWVTAAPDWPARLSSLGTGLVGSADAGSPSRQARQDLGLVRLRETLPQELAGNVLGGTRLDNLVCDGFLPLLGAAGQAGGYHLWFHWFLGDVPDHVRKALTKLGVSDGRAQPQCHGYAQGLLGWLLEREAMQVAD